MKRIRKILSMLLITILLALLAFILVSCSFNTGNNQVEASYHPQSGNVNQGFYINPNDGIYQPKEYDIDSQGYNPWINLYE